MNLSIAGSQQFGAANISTYLRGLLTEFKTQHNFDTHKIGISEDAKSAVGLIISLEKLTLSERH
jgi:hypothetical protein